MTQEEIKVECSNIYSQIRQAECRLKEIRDICKHPKTFQTNYSYRSGAVQLVTICKDCGYVIDAK